MEVANFGAAMDTLIDEDEVTYLPLWKHQLHANVKRHFIVCVFIFSVNVALVSFNNMINLENIN